MPTFCRHNRLLQNCTICAREQHFEVRPIVSGGASSAALPHSPKQAPRPPREAPLRPIRRTSAGATRTRGNGVRVRRLARAGDDGFRSPLVPGLKSGDDAERLAQELAFSAARLGVIRSGSLGLWSEVADAAGDIEERTWLAFLIAYIGPDDSEAPFAAITAARTAWSSAQPPHFVGLEAGPRGAYDPTRADETVAAYRAWAARAGSQQAAFLGDPAWGAERRFERLYERLALPGMTRGARFELLTLLGETGVYQLRAWTLALGGENQVTWAAKRVFGIGDPLLLERRAAELAAACAVPLQTLDLALRNWGAGVRCGAGVAVDAPPESAVLTRTRDALGL